MNKIEELRQRIDNIDDGIAKLFNERMQVIKEIGQEKATSSAPLTDTGREKSVINRICRQVDDDKILYAKQTFETLFDVSKAYQKRFLPDGGVLVDEIKGALENSKSFPISATVACQGVAGAYSMLACEKLFPVSDIMYFKDWNGVFSAIENGLCNYGILPIENSTAGSVNGVYDLILKHKFYIARTVLLKIKHSLLAKKGVCLSDVREIYSHEQAIAQCSEFLKTMPDVKVTVVENTAVAARMVAKSDRTDVAALSSPECAVIYGLTSLKGSVQNAGNNYTRFICISKNLQIFERSDKISIVTNLPHKTGALNKLLTRFAALNINITKIQSRPIAESDFEFVFYFDFDGDVRSREVLNLLSELNGELENFTFLGAYSEIR